jgi:hypothetical protein
MLLWKLLNTDKLRNKIETAVFTLIGQRVISGEYWSVISSGWLMIKERMHNLSLTFSSFRS